MIELRNINYTYNIGLPDARQALFDVSLTIADGSLCALIGSTGSGKSTLIRHLNGLLRPSSGTILIDGADITSKDADTRNLRRKVGLVFQYPEYQLFEETVEKDIAFGPKNLGLSESEITQRVRYAAELMGISDRNLQKSPFELSGGEKRRAAIAGVLAMMPEILVLDEPSAGLDPKWRENITDIIRNLHKTNPNMIILFVSHSMEDVAETAEHIYVMDKGRIVMDGTPDTVFSHASELTKIGLDVPQITRLVMRLNEMGFGLPDDIYTTERAEKEILRRFKQ